MIKRLLIRFMVTICFGCVSFLQIHAQTYYDQQWKRIEDNSKKGIYKNNLPLIKNIQSQAMKDKNVEQIVKSLKAEFKILNTIEDDSKNDSTSKIFTKIKSTHQQLKGDDQLLFQVLMGEFFSEFYLNNSWRINPRTNIERQDFSQIETWSKLDFKKYFSDHFSALEKEKSKFQKILLSKYKSLFQNTEDLDYYENLYYWNTDRYIEFLSDKDFFTPKEVNENYQKINTLYDEIISESSGNTKLYFLEKQLDYKCTFYNYYPICEDQYHFNKLKKLVENKDLKGDYKVKIIADMIYILEDKKDFKTALIWVDKARKLYPDSKFQNNITNIENTIKASKLTLRYQKQTQSNQPIQLVAEGKNVKKFSINIYEVKDDISGFLSYVFDFDNFDSDNNPFNNVKKTLIRKDQFNLNFPKDFKTYSTALEMNPLPSGIYLAEYIINGKIQSTFYFIVSDSRVVHQNRNEQNPSKNLFKLVNSENGKPFASENIEFFEYIYKKPLNTGKMISDPNGIFSFPESNSKKYYQNYLLKSSGNNYHLIQVYGQKYSSQPDENQTLKHAQIFIDRSIYRPGQIVYFKVINTHLQDKKETVNVDLKQEISLYDANEEKISSQTFTTNEFGSYSGSFTLPKGKLNGSFSLRITENGINAHKSFKVEEYKRPKFQIIFDTISKEYKYGQTIKIKGKAIMFSGVPLTDCSVNFEIKKENIRWKYFEWYPQDVHQENSILGTVKTDEKGEFEITLNLEKDPNLDGIQVDNYKVDVSITDTNGETQFAETNIRVASVSHYINAENIGEIFSDDELKVKVETKNYNDQNLDKTYNATLERLKEPQRIFRSIFENDIQNYPQMSPNEFYQKFPHDRYDKNDLRDHLKTEKVILNQNGLHTSEINFGKLPAGTYKLRIYNIEGKDSIKTEQTFTVWDRKKLNNQYPMLHVLKEKGDFIRGKKAKFYLYSAIPNALITVFIQDGKGNTKTEMITIKNGVHRYEIQAPKDKTISALNIHFQLVAFNDVASQTFSLPIKDDQMQLKIETTTFRDQLQPNQKEKWTVKVIQKNNNHTRPLDLTAELLVNMYDKSLDQFAPNNYSWKQIENISNFSNYDIYHIPLDRESYGDRYQDLENNIVSIPYFQWLDEPYNVVAPESLMTPEARLVTKKLRTHRITTNYTTMTNSVAAYNAENTQTKKDEVEKIPVRENLNETAFFYPNLTTDKEGNVSFEFTSPEALTQWKLMFLAHTKDARATILEKKVVTQKEFSVTPNYPRFLREGDELQIQSKLSNLTHKKLTGTAQLQILDAFTNEDLSEKFGLSNLTQVANYNFNQPFLVEPNSNSEIKWKLKVPNDLSSVIVKIVAKAENFSDGEQKTIAVLPNRMLITDAQPIFLKGGQTKTFTLQNLAENTSDTASNISNTLELTTNPIWEILFALPGLKDDNNISADVVFNKWFADVLASEFFKTYPKIKTVFDEYQSKGLLESDLQKNQELKQLLLEETPWVLKSKSEAEEMQKLKRIFDANTMRNSINEDWRELLKLQNSDGGFSWYPGYPSSYHTSLYILKNLGKINEWLKANLADYQTENQKMMVKNLINYVDNHVSNHCKTDSSTFYWNNFVLDYLDARHYWENDFPLKNRGAVLKSKVITKAKTADPKDFTFFGLHRAALLFNEYGLKKVSKKIINYLKETSTQTKTQGVYWKQNLNDWAWYSSEIVNHAGVLEVFEKLSPNDIEFIEEMKIWLVTQKEVNSWKTSRNTAEVIFTMLNSSKSWISNEGDKAEISWGGKIVNTQTQATGYVKQTIHSKKIDKNLATVTVTKPQGGIAQGGVFWQYYEDMDKVKSSESYISITKELYKKVKTENGEKLQKISATTPLKIGDKVTVRMILNTDRNMEFIHLKDMHAAGFEPIDVISRYQWKNNFGYYQSIKDASTNFYIETLPKGKYVFENDYICNIAGKFSNGIATLQNYYAPQMNAHTQNNHVEIQP